MGRFALFEPTLWIRADDAYLAGEKYTLYDLRVWCFAGKGFLAIDTDLWNTLDQWFLIGGHSPLGERQYISSGRETIRALQHGKFDQW